METLGDHNRRDPVGVGGGRLGLRNGRAASWGLATCEVGASHPWLVDWQGCIDRAVRSKPATVLLDVWSKRSALRPEYHRHLQKPLSLTLADLGYFYGIADEIGSIAVAFREWLRRCSPAIGRGYMLS